MKSFVHCMLKESSADAYSTHAIDLNKYAPWVSPTNRPTDCKARLEGGEGDTKRGRIPRSTRKPYVPTELKDAQEKDSSGGSSEEGSGTRGISGMTRFGSYLPRVYIYVVGGMTYSEIASVYDLISVFNREITIVSSNIITPNLFVNYLAQDHHDEAE